jgi:hypothetical protein
MDTDVPNFQHEHYSDHLTGGIIIDVLGRQGSAADAKSLDGNPIEEYVDYDSLEYWLPQMEELRSHNIPVYETDEKVLGRLSAWTKLMCNIDDTEEDTFRRLRRIFNPEIQAQEPLGQKLMVDYLYDDLYAVFQSLFHRMHQKNLVNAESKDATMQARMQSVHRLFEALEVGYNVVALLSRFRHLTDPQATPWLPEPKNMVVYEREPEGKMNECMAAKLLMLDYCRRNNFRKRGRRVYKERFLPGGRISTHSWIDICDIEELCYRAVEPAAVHAKFWRCMNHGKGNHQSVAEFLEKTYNQDFPFLELDRRLFAFKNGIFDASQPGGGAFYVWGSPHIKPKMAVAKYFDVMFEEAEYEKQMGRSSRMRVDEETNEMLLDAKGNPVPLANDWTMIETPAIESVLEGQNFPFEVRLWFYIFSGKLLHWLREHDCWEGQAYFKGIAGTGKSTSLKTYENIYEKIYVGILSDTVERNFPLESLLGCSIWLGMDISEDFQLQQTLWQSMVSGESIGINRKNKTKVCVRWLIPGAMAGNQLPRWSDNAGSLSRRWWLFAFLKIVTNVDPDLFKKIELQMPAFLKKCTCAYQDASTLWGLTDVWKQLPDYFKNTKKMIARESNGLEAFLHSTDVKSGAGLYVPLSEFRDKFKEFCGKNGYGEPPRWTEDYYQAIFQARGISITEDEIVQPYPVNSPSSIMRDKFILGVDVVHHKRAAAQNNLPNNNNNVQRPRFGSMQSLNASPAANGNNLAPMSPLVVGIS